MPDFPYIDFQGHKRYLSCLPSDPKAMALNPNWKSEKSTIAKSDIIDWIKKNGGHYDLGEMILSPILDQDGIGACLPPGTSIRMADGSEKVIQDVKLLDKVRTAEGNVGRVNHLFVRQTKELCQILLAGGGMLFLTEEHPIYTDKGYIPAGRIDGNDTYAMLPRRDGTHDRLKIESVLRIHYEGDVYNFEVEGDNSYVAEGVGVHNCASFSATSCFNLTWNLMNQTQHVFSPFFQYAQVNGGVDQGSSPVDNMNSLMKTGICLDADNPKRGYFPRNIPQICYEAAKRYKVSKAYTITGSDDLLTAIMLNRPVGFGMSLPSSFQQINQGTGMPTPGGFLGLHGMLIRGLYYHPKVNDLVPVVQNSWTQSFGIQDATRFGWQDSNALKGCCFIPLGMIITPQYFEAWCCESNYLDPEQKIPIAA